MEPKYEIGQEIEAYCQHCKLNLDCTVSAMEGDEIRQVQCHTCNNFMAYRAPVDEGVRKDRILKRALRMRDMKTARPKPSAEPSPSQADPRWIEVTRGVDSTWAVPYRAEAAYEEGDFLLHKRFGMGHVERVEQADEIAVIFRQGLIFLPMNQSSEEGPE